MSDVFRTIPLRTLGYGFAAGEALLYISNSNTADVCYTVGSVFIIGHIIYVLVKTSDGNFIKPVLQTAGFEVLASALIPTFIVYHTCRLTAHIVNDSNMSGNWRRWVPTVVGFCAMAVIMTPLDNFVDHIMGQVFS